MQIVPADVSIDRLSDAELVQQCLQGDRHCYAHLYRRYQQRVRSTLYQLCGAEDLDDLVQDVFLRVWKGLPKFRQQSNFSTWLYRISWNVAADRRREFIQQRNLQSKAIASYQSHADTRATHSYTPDLMLLHYQDLVQRGLAQLSFDLRSVLVLHDLEDMPQKEVAAILGVPVGTVKSRLFRARAAMRQFLDVNP